MHLSQNNRRRVREHTNPVQHEHMNTRDAADSPRKDGARADVTICSNSSPNEIHGVTSTCYIHGDLCTTRNNLGGGRILRYVLAYY